VHFEVDVADFAEAKEIAAAMGEHEERLHFHALFEDDVARAVQLAVQARQYAQHELFGRKDIFLVVVEKVLELTNLREKDSLGQIPLHLRGQVLVKVVVFEVVPSGTLYRLIYVRLGELDERLGQATVFDLHL